MKNIFSIAFFTIVFFSVTVMVHAQDSSGVKKQVDASGEKSDNLHGKKIQQQSLSSGKFEKLDSALPKPVVKKKIKNKRKHQ